MRQRGRKRERERDTILKVFNNKISKITGKHVLFDCKIRHTNRPLLTVSEQLKCNLKHDWKVKSYTSLVRLY